MYEIGGYFELEVKEGKFSYHYDESFKLSSGRASLLFILKYAQPSKVYLPYYCCDSLIEPVKSLNILYEFYEINEKFEIAQLFSMSNKEILIYINFFGLKREYCEELELKYGNKLIIDHTHDFFFRPHHATKCYHFNSVRKFFGVPDGSFLYFPIGEKVIFDNYPYNVDYKINHLIKRFEENANSGYSFYVENEQNIQLNIRRMSKFTSLLLSNIDYNEVVTKRSENFYYLHQHLRTTNKLESLCGEIAEKVPFCYPYLPQKKISHSYFWERNVFVPILWKECLIRLDTFSFEKKIAEEIIPLPVDHRYNSFDLYHITEIIKNG